MNVSEILSRIKYVPFTEAAEKMRQAVFGHQDAAYIKSFYVAGDRSGKAMLIPYTNEQGVHCYIEVAISLDSEDSITSCVESDQMFANKTMWVDARTALIDEIAVIMQTMPKAITVMDEGRGRQVHLHEMGTMQLVEILELARQQGGLAPAEPAASSIITAV